MSASLATFKTTVEKLIRKFESDRTHYFSKSYSEAQARVDFITPFFKALGWDVENEQGLAHHAREVVVEAAEDTRGRPDYSFRVAAQTKFFVEAKAPSEELDAARHVIQAKSWPMLESNDKKHSGKLAPSEVDRIDPDIAATEREIDNLVYDLYGIIDEERKIIEGAS